MKSLIFTLITAILSFPAVSIATGNPVATSNGQVKFTGSITEGGCVLASGNTSIIDLGSYSTTRLATSNQPSGLYSGPWSTGEIKFVDCDLSSGISAVYIKVLPGDMTNNSGNVWTWVNQGTAENVYLQIVIVDSDGDHELYPQYIKDPFRAAIDSVNKSALFIVKARVIAYPNKAKPGNIEVTTTFVAHYK